MKTNKTKNTNRIVRFGRGPRASAPAESEKGETAREMSNATGIPVEFTTEVTAKIDVGFGNQLFIRGQGNGLSWEKGAPLQCKDGSTWVWSTGTAREKVIFKLLLNDQVWARGEDLMVEAGRKVETVPQF